MAPTTVQCPLRTARDAARRSGKAIRSPGRLYAYHEAMPADQVTMFRPRPDVGLGRRWHVLDHRLNGFMLVAPFPCTFVQASILSEQVAATRDRVTRAAPQRMCRLCVDGMSRS